MFIIVAGVLFDVYAFMTATLLKAVPISWIFIFDIASTALGAKKDTPVFVELTRMLPAILLFESTIVSIPIRKSPETGTGVWNCTTLHPHRSVE